MKTVIIIYLFFLAFAFTVIACGGGQVYTQCTPCDIDCEEQVIVNPPITSK